jgi:hypothetical protein
MTDISAETIFARICSWPIHATDYLSAGKLLHAITVAEVLTILSIVSMIGKHPLAYPTLITLSLFPLFTQLDARSRFQEYKQVRDQLARYGPDRRIFMTVASSRCQRDAALAAAGQLGYAQHCRFHYCAAGYRWFHLFPNFVKDHPRFLISAAFWRTTFFMPTYQVRTRLPLKTERRSVSVSMFSE